MAIDGGSNRSVVLASADVALRQRLRVSLIGMRWQVREASGGAEAMAQMDELRPEALVMDHWLPDLEAGEFAGQVAMMYPGVDVLRVDGDAVAGSIRSPRRHELLHALREALDGQQTGATDGAAWATAPVSVPQSGQGAWLDPRIPKTTPESARKLGGSVATTCWPPVYHSLNP